MPVEFGKHSMRFGVGGLDLRRSVDLVDTLNATILTNAIRLPDGGWTARLGQQDLATAATAPLHSIVRGIDVPTGTSNLFWGSGTVLYRGTSSVLSSVQTGFSGQPLSLVPWQSKQSGESWIIVGDSAQCKKVRVKDGLVLPIGLTEPTGVPTLAVTALNPSNNNQKFVEKFLDATIWNRFTNGTLIPDCADVTPGKGGQAKMLEVTVKHGLGTTGYWSAIDVGKTLNLSTFGGGVDVTDDDYFHFWLRFTDPVLLSEIRVYLTTANATTGTSSWAGGYIPGADGVHNIDGYYKAFRPSDTTPILNGALTTSVTPIIATRTATDDAVKSPPTTDGDAPPADPTTTTDQVPTTGSPSVASAAGANTWTEWGSVGIPLRRGDFQPIGEPDWSKVEGLTIQMFVSAPNPTPPGIKVYFSDMYLAGGSGPDTGEPGTQKYDYVYSNYDPRTGAEGNTTALDFVMPSTTWVDSLRQSITITPQAGSDSAWLQRFYRRGGTLTDNWRYVGINASNGAAFVDTLSDTEIVTADTAPIDYYAAVPSVNSSGGTVLGAKTPYMWGPLQGLIFAAGDPNRPGSVYFPYADSVDQWSANGYVDVCSSTEKIVGGFILGSQSFAWSTQKLYALNLNFGDANTVVSSVTSCTRAPVTPWSFTTGNGVCWFLAYDGIYATDGGPEVNITDNWVRSLFQGQTVNGLAPIDLSAATALRMAVFQNELHAMYQDVNGVNQGIVYHLTDKVWRHVYYENAVRCLYTDITTSTGRLLFGTGAGGGMVYGGNADLYTPISVHIRTNAENQGYSKSLKRYSDFTLDINPAQTAVTVNALTRYNEVTTGTLSIPSTENGRQPYIFSFAPDPALSITLGLDITWATNAPGPVVYSATSTFEVEPPTITRWSSLPVDHGVVGWHMATGMFLSLRSTESVDLTVVAYGQGGTVLNTHTYTVAGTNFEKFKDYIPFVATKGAFYSYQLSSVKPFVVYPNESTVRVQPWGSDQTLEVPVIGILRENTEAFNTYTARAAQTSGN